MSFVQWSSHTDRITVDDADELLVKVGAVWFRMSKANLTKDIPQANITDLTTDLSNKAPISHTHAQSEITGLVTALASKAAISHTHVISDVTSLQTTLDSKFSATNRQTAITNAEISDVDFSKVAIGGTPDGTKFVRDDGTFQSVVGGSSSSTLKTPARAATVASGTLASDFENGDTIDGVTLATGDIILIKNQTTASENGKYIVSASGAPIRDADLNDDIELPSSIIQVSEGTENHDTLWMLTNDGAITVGTTDLVFEKIADTLEGVQTVQIDSTSYVPNIALNNTDIVPGNLDQIGTPTIGFSSATVSREYLNVEHQSRIGVTGDVVGAKIFVGTGHDNPSLTGVIVRIWREDPDLTDMLLVGESNNIRSGFVGIGNDTVATITFAAPITGVQEGDYVSIRLEGPAGSVLRAKVGNENPSVMFEEDTVQNTGHDWAGATPTNAYPPIEIQVQAPNLLSLGDSILEGANTHKTYLNVGTLNNSDTQIIKKISDNYSAQNMNYRNMAIGGHTTTQMVARLTEDVIDMHPRACVLMGGTNDLLQAVPNATILANITTILDALVLNNIEPILIKVIPGTSYTDGESLLRRTLNASLGAFAISHNALVIDMDPVLGQIRGSTGELDDLQAAFNDDGIHLLEAGNVAFANAVITAMNGVGAVKVDVIAFPQLNQAQIDGTSPLATERLFVFNTTANRLEFYNGTSWLPV